MKTLKIAMIALCLSGSVFAMEGKVTLESGTASAKKNLHGKTITAEETALMWKKYAKIPTSSGSGVSVERVYTLLWKGSLDRGNFVLNQSFRNFDEIVTIGANDNGSYPQHYRFTPKEFDLAVKARGYATLYERDSRSWVGTFAKNNRTFYTRTESARLLEIYGVNFN